VTTRLGRKIPAPAPTATPAAAVAGCGGVKPVLMRRLTCSTARTMVWRGRRSSNTMAKPTRIVRPTAQAYSPRTAQESSVPAATEGGTITQGVLAKVKAMFLSRRILIVSPT